MDLRSPPHGRHVAVGWFWVWMNIPAGGWLAASGSSWGKYQRQGRLSSVTTSAAEIWASHTQGTPVRATAGLQGAGRASAGGKARAGHRAVDQR